MNPIYLDTFTKSTLTMFQEMVNIKIESSESPTDGEDFLDHLNTYSSISFSGKLKGRFILNVSDTLGKKICENLLGEKVDTLRNRLNLSGISELSNTISGDAITHLNNQYNLSLRLAPPVVATGNNMGIASIKMSSKTIHLSSDYGNLLINIAIEGGDVI